MSLASQISALATRVATEVKLRGMPVGGATGQVLAKTSATDFAASWIAAPSGSGGAYVPSTHYKGTWASGTAYILGDLVVRSGVLYEAVAPSTGIDPLIISAPFLMGGPDGITQQTYNQYAAQQITNPTARTYTKVQTVTSGPGRVGFTRNKPTDGTAVTWLAYADVPAASTIYVAYDLNTPLVVASGDTVWMVWVGNSASSYMYVNTATSTHNTLSSIWRYVTFSDFHTIYYMNVQAISLTASWNEALDIAGSGFTRLTTTLTAVSGDGTVALAPGFKILSVAYSGAGRLRLYRTAAGRTADAARSFTTARVPGRDLVYDYLATGAETDDYSPVNDYQPAGETVTYYRVDTGPITITITWQRTE